MFPLYFMLFFFVLSDGSVGTQSYVNYRYVDKGLCEQYLEDTKQIVIQTYGNIEKIHGWCVEKDWPFQPDAQPKGSI